MVLTQPRITNIHTSTETPTTQEPTTTATNTRAADTILLGLGWLGAALMAPQQSHELPIYELCTDDDEYEYSELLPVDWSIEYDVGGHINVHCYNSELNEYYILELNAYLDQGSLWIAHPDKPKTAHDKLLSVKDELVLLVAQLTCPDWMNSYLDEIVEDLVDEWLEHNELHVLDEFMEYLYSYDAAPHYNTYHLEIPCHPFNIPTVI